MDEFLSMAIWVMMIFLSVNTVIIWVGAQPEAQALHLDLQGVQTNDSFGEAAVNSLNSIANQTCNLVSQNIFAYIPCFFIGLSSAVLSLLNGFWSILTVWSGLIDSIFSIVPGTEVFGQMLITLFSLIEISAIIVISMRIAAIIRGVAGGFL